MLHPFKVDDPHSTTFIFMKLIFGWYVVWCGSMNGVPKEMCLKYIGLRAQHMITILHSTINIIKGPI